MTFQTFDFSHPFDLAAETFPTERGKRREHGPDLPILSGSVKAPGAALSLSKGDGRFLGRTSTVSASSLRTLSASDASAAAAAGQSFHSAIIPAVRLSLAPAQERLLSDLIVSMIPLWTYSVLFCSLSCVSVKKTDAQSVSPRSHFRAFALS